MIAAFFANVFSAIIHMHTDMLPYLLDADMLGNLIIAGSLTLLAYRKTKDWLLSGYYGFLAMIIGLVCVNIVGIVIVLLSDITAGDIMHNWLFAFISVALMLIVCYPFARLTGAYLNGRYSGLSYEVKKQFAKYGFILSSLTFVLTHARVFLYRAVTDQDILLAIDMLIVTVILFVAITMTANYSLSQQRQMEAELKNRTQKNLDEYTKNLEKSHNEVRNFWHDHRNILYGLLGHIDRNNHEGREYAKKNIANAENILAELVKAMDYLNFIHIPELKGLLAAKLAQAQSHGIKVEVGIIEPICEIHMDRTEICQVVGIMLDNAIEELLIHDDGHRFLAFGIIVDGDDVLITCENTCKIQPPIDRLFDEGYSTKGSNRGLGLYNLEQVCKRNPNLGVTLCTDDDLFSITLTVMGS